MTQVAAWDAQQHCDTFCRVCSSCQLACKTIAVQMCASVYDSTNSSCDQCVNGITVHLLCCGWLCCCRFCLACWPVWHLAGSPTCLGCCCRRDSCRLLSFWLCSRSCLFCCTAGTGDVVSASDWRACQTHHPCLPRLLLFSHLVYVTIKAYIHSKDRSPKKPEVELSCMDMHGKDCSMQRSVTSILDAAITCCA